MSIIFHRKNISLSKFAEFLSILIPRLGVSAYLENPSETVTVLPDVYYPVSGPFTNTTIHQFELIEDAIKYTGSSNVWVDIDYRSVFESDTNNTLIATAIKLNGDVIQSSFCSMKLKAIGDYGPTSGIATEEISTDDEIQLVVKSNQGGATLTAHTFSAKLRRAHVI